MFDGLKPYPEYRTVELPWLWKLPAHWTLCAVKRAFEVQLGKMLQGQPSTGDALVPYFKAQHVQWSGVRTSKLPVMWASSKDLSQYGVRHGDLLVCEGGEGGRCGIVQNPPSNAIIQNSLHRVRPKADDRVEYLSVVMSCISSWGWFDALNNKATIAHFTRDKFGALGIPLPPPDEQAGIVRFLGAVDRKVNRFIRAKRRLIELLTEQKQAIITHAVTKGLNPAAPKKPSGIDWLGDVPRHWEVKRLRHIIRGRLTYGANEAAEHDRTDWPRYLRITDFGGDGGLRADTFRSLPPEIAADYMVQPGDVLLARSGATVGKAFLVDERATNACHAGYLIRARPNQADVNPKFLFLYTQSTAYASWRAATFNIATIENIGADKYANLPVPLPPRAEQDRILVGLADRLKPGDGAVAAARREIDLIREYRTRLVADVVTGKVDVRAAAAAIPDEDADPGPDPGAGEPGDDADPGDADADGGADLEPALGAAGTEGAGGEDEA